MREKRSPNNSIKSRLYLEPVA